MVNKPFVSDNLLISRIQDLAKLSQNKNTMKFTWFLDEHQQEVAKMQIRKIKGVNSCFFGGYDGAKRQMLGFFPDYIDMQHSQEHFDISCILIKHLATKELSHRDFLGTLLGLGVKRELIGDIEVLDGETMCFVSKTIEQLVISEVKKVANVGVLPQVVIGVDFKPIEKFKVLSSTVSSIRLDKIVAICTGQSRQTAQALIDAGKVNLNHIQQQQREASIVINDVISIRGYGRFILNEVSSPNKKGKFAVKLSKYL